MSMKRITAAGGTLLALGFFAGSLEGCGSSASDNKALCKNACDKTLMCHPELAPFLVNCEQQCNTMTGASGGTSCKNQSAIIAKFNECLGKPCGAAYDACTAAIPDCEGGGGGTGGTTGSGGSASGTGGSGTGGSGTGGSGSDASAGGTCETCTKADACCNAFIQGFDGGQCEFAAECSAATGNDRTQLVGICQMFLMNFSANPAAPAACK